MLTGKQGKTGALGVDAWEGQVSPPPNTHTRLALFFSALGLLPGWEALGDLPLERLPREARRLHELGELGVVLCVELRCGAVWGDGAETGSDARGGNEHETDADLKPHRVDVEGKEDGLDEGLDLRGVG